MLISFVENSVIVPETKLFGHNGSGGDQYAKKNDKIYSSLFGSFDGPMFSTIHIRCTGQWP